MKKHSILGLSAVGLFGMLVVAGPAYADGGARKNSLDSDLAVRHRRLLVKNRFELSPLFESTINAEFHHIVGGGAKLEYHLGDMLSFGVVVVGSTAINTGLVNKIVPTLPTQAAKQANEMATPPIFTRDPSQEEFLDHLNTMPVHGAAYVSITPWYGKLAAFGASYVAFDFYFQAGVAFAQLSSNCPSNICSDTHPGKSIMNGADTLPPDNDPNNDPPLNSGGRVGLYLGGGIHVFLNDFLALDLTIRDYAFSDNPSGADFNADQFVGTNSNGGDDNRFIHHLFFGTGLSIMFPTTVKRTP